MRLLFDLRPALEGHAGVPQETRLLFDRLAHLSGVELTGLVQGAPHGTGVGQRHGLLPLLAAAGGGEALSLQPVPLQGDERRLWDSLFAKTLPPEASGLLQRVQLRELQAPRVATQLLALATGLAGGARFPRLDTRGFDLMLAQTPYPGRVAPGTRLLVRYFDAIPLTLPHTVKHRHLHGPLHRNALWRNAGDGAWFVCCSEATRADLLRLRPELEARSATIPCMLSHHFHDTPAAPERLARLLPAQNYLLMVSTLEPRKNHLVLIDAWERLRRNGWPDLHLVIVGSPGWHHDAVLARMQPGIAEGRLHWLRGVATDDLRLLYRHASATVTPSLGEGFGYSGVEAMRSGGLVVASDIPVHRGVYRDAAAYFDTASSAALATCLASLLAPEAEAHRQALRAEGARVAASYLPDALLPQWQALLERISA